MTKAKKGPKYDILTTDCQQLEHDVRYIRPANTTPKKIAYNWVPLAIFAISCPKLTLNLKTFPWMALYCTKSAQQHAWGTGEKKNLSRCSWRSGSNECQRFRYLLHIKISTSQIHLFISFLLVHSEAAQQSVWKYLQIKIELGTGI